MLRASYFDGRSTRVRGVNLAIVGEDLHVAGEDLDLRVPFSRIKVDERLGRAPRRLRFEDGAFCEVRDLDGLDALLASSGHRDGWVDRAQRHLPAILISCVACVGLLFLGYEFVLPWAAERAASRLPPAVGETLSSGTLQALDEGKLLLPSKIPQQRREELEARFRALQLPEGGTPHSPLLFRDSPALGANAFTLPDGTVIMLDGLINIMQDDQQIMAVAAHELGHAHGRHSLRLLLQGTAVGAFWTFYIGDVSQLAAAAPVAFIHARYSRDLEQEADDYGAQLLEDNGMSPGLLADALQKVMAAHPSATKGGGGYLASHPPTDERMKHLRELAQKSAHGAGR